MLILIVSGILLIAATPSPQPSRVLTPRESNQATSQRSDTQAPPTVTAQPNPITSQNPTPHTENVHPKTEEQPGHESAPATLAIPAVLNSNFFLAMMTILGTGLGTFIAVWAGFTNQRREWKKRDKSATAEQTRRETAAGKAVAIELLLNWAALFSVCGVAKQNKPLFSLPAIIAVQFDRHLPLIALLLDYEELMSVVRAYGSAGFFRDLHSIVGQQYIVSIPLNAKNVENIGRSMREFHDAYDIVAKKVFSQEEVQKLKEIQQYLRQ